MKLRTALFILFVVSSFVLWQIGGLANGLALAESVQWEVKYFNQDRYKNDESVCKGRYLSKL